MSTPAERSARYRAKDIDAYREKKREYVRTPGQKEKRNEYMRGWRERNRAKHNQQAKESRARHRDACLDRTRRAYYLKRYGITIEEKAMMVARQEGKCRICEGTFKTVKSAHVDHCHKTGKVRGILCHVCNTKLGWFERYAQSVEEYLEQKE